MKRILFLFTVVVFACSNREITYEGPVILDVFNNNNTGFSFKSIEIIPLETSDSVLIGDLGRIKAEMTDDEIFLANGYDSRSIYRFKNNGQYINSIGDQGRGPEEYVSIVDLIVHGDTADVLSREGDGVNVVGYNDEGMFLYNNYIDIQSFSFEKLSSDYFFAASYNYPLYNYRLYIMDDSGELIDTLLPQFVNYTSLLMEDNFSKYGESVYYHEEFNDTVYKVTGRGAVPSYILDFGDFALPEEYYTAGDTRSALVLLNNRKGFAHLGSYMESTDFAYFQFNVQSAGQVTINNLLYNKKNDELSVESFLYTEESFFKYPVSIVSDDEMAFLISPYLILSQRESFEHMPLKNPEVINSLNEEDNPVLVICGIK